MKLINRGVLDYFRDHANALHKAIGQCKSPNDRIKLSMTRTEAEVLVDHWELLLMVANSEEEFPSGPVSDLQKKIAIDWVKQCAESLPFTPPDFPEQAYQNAGTTMSDKDFREGIQKWNEIERGERK
jgi:hypothetical protein